MSSANRTTPTADQRAIAAFLRGLADQAERDEPFAATLRRLLGEAGLLGGEGNDIARPARAAKKRPARVEAPEAAHEEMAIDPFAALRTGGEAGLRSRLEALDLPTLRQIVRTHRLDPARISARWSARDRVVSLIVEQTRARVNHGRAFRHIE